MTNNIKNLQSEYKASLLKAIAHLEYSFNKTQKLPVDPSQLNKEKLETWAYQKIYDIEACLIETVGLQSSFTSSPTVGLQSSFTSSPTVGLLSSSLALLAGTFLPAVGLQSSFTSSPAVGLQSSFTSSPAVGLMKNFFLVVVDDQFEFSRGSCVFYDFISDSLHPPSFIKKI